MYTYNLTDFGRQKSVEVSETMAATCKMAGQDKG